MKNFAEHPPIVKGHGLSVVPPSGNDRAFPDPERLADVSVFGDNWPTYSDQGFGMPLNTVEFF